MAAAVHRGPPRLTDVVKLMVEMTVKERNRFDAFFVDNGGREKPLGVKIMILVDLALTHPHIAGESSRSKLPRMGMPSAARKRPRRTDKSPIRKERCSSGQEYAGGAEVSMGDNGNCTSAIDSELPINNNSERKLAEDAPANVESETVAWSGAACGGAVATTASPREENSDDCESPYVVNGPGGGKVHYAAPLLSKRYYERFSADARTLKLDGREGSVADVATTPTMLLEQRQLKKLLRLVQCAETGCGETLDLQSLTLRPEGYTVVVSGLCRSGAHRFHWATSAVVQHLTKEKSCTYTLNVATPAAVLISGGNYWRMKRLATALSLQWGSESQHNRIQRGAVCPAIAACTGIVQDEIYENIRRQSGRLIVAGDGQFDSPGSCANCCAYSLLAVGFEQEDEETGEKQVLESGYIISLELVDRRHAQGKSPAMERIGLHAAMRKLYDNDVSVAELVTDEHTQVTADFKRVQAASKELGRMKSLAQSRKRKRATGTMTAMARFQAMLQHPPLVSCSDAEVHLLHRFYARILHSIDIWHKGKNIKKNVLRISNTAPMPERPIYRARASHLSNHLWYCAEKAGGDADKFTMRWIRTLKHVQGDHGDCEHDDRADRTPPLSSPTRAFESLERYIGLVARAAPLLCRFRHTSLLESFHAMSLAYASKRNNFDYDMMLMRKRLAAFHHNHNFARPWKRNKDGSIVVKHKWSKASKDYVPVFAREAPRFEYYAHLMAAIFYERVTGDYDFSGHAPNTVVSAQHPTHIRATNAPYRQAPSKTYENWRSRKPEYRRHASDPGPLVAGSSSNQDASDDDYDGDDGDESGYSNPHSPILSEDEFINSSEDEY